MVSMKNKSSFFLSLVREFSLEHREIWSALNKYNNRGAEMSVSLIQVIPNYFSLIGGHSVHVILYNDLLSVLQTLFQEFVSSVTTYTLSSLST